MTDMLTRPRGKRNRREEQAAFKAGSDASKKTRRQEQAEGPGVIDQAKQASGAWDASGKPLVPPKRKKEPT